MRQMLEQRRFVSVAEMAKRPVSDCEVVTVGVVVQSRRSATKRGDPFITLKIHDLTDSEVPLLLFGDAEAAHRRLLPGDMLAVLA